MLIVINLYNKYNYCSFNSILDIYRTGVLHLNTDLCALVLQKDLEYWQIDELILGMMPKYMIMGLLSMNVWLVFKKEVLTLI